jgi:ABC-type glycerol-3-phosphate transport system permease component
MKKFYISIPFVLLLLASLSNIVYAQAPAGPSDAVTAPPAASANVGKVLCNSQSISISGPQDVNNTDFAVYHWYKLDASGNQQSTTITGKTYTEVPTTPGYYNYVLVTENTNGCTSPTSDIFKVFVLPQLNASITTPSNSICTGIGTTILTANIAAVTGYTFNYQWTRNGTNIPGATANTYTVSGETTGATVTFGVNIINTLNTTCSATATHDIVITPLAGKPLITAN